MNGTIRASVARGVARLELAHPPLNILTRQVLADLRAVLGDLSRDATLRAVVLTAEGPNFSAGADVREHLPPEDAALIPEFLDTVQALDAFPVPVIAGVRGRCLGAGFELVQAVDLIVAGEGATFGQPEIRLGVIPPAACVLLPQKLPAALARWLVYSGEPMTAAKAEQAGFVTRIVPDEAVAEAAGELAAGIAKNSAAALRLAKRAFHQGAAEARAAALRGAGDLYLDVLMATADAVEGLRSFVEKRQPAWSDR
jgi:cyclohexa-1,5-dienecarbonyl-CoA hydratase